MNEPQETELPENALFNPIKADQSAIVTLIKCYCGNPEIYIKFIELLDRNQLFTSQALIDYGNSQGKVKMVRLGHQVKSYEINKWKMLEKSLNACRGEIKWLKEKVAKGGSSGCWVNNSQARAIEQL